MVPAPPPPPDDAKLGAAHVGLIALGCVALTLLLYYPAIPLYFVGDDVAFVHPDPHWLSEALNPHQTWHFYPVTQILIYGITALSGWRPAVMHGLNLLLHAGAGIGLCLWLRQLRIDPRVCAIAPLWFVARGVSYEVVTWITELSYLLSVVFSLLTLSWWERYLRGAGERWRAATVAGFAVALLTIEHNLILVPLYLLFDVLMGRERSLPLLRRPDSGWSSWARAWFPLAGRAVARYLPFALVVIAFLTVKHFQSRGLLLSSLDAGGPAAPPVPSGMDVMIALPPERSWLGFLNTPLRAYLDLLLASSYLFLPIAGAFGAEDTWLTRHAGLVLLPWLAIHLWVIVRGRPFTRFLLAWVYLYVLPLAIASVPQARYYYMSTVPASVLWALAVAGAWKALGRRVPARWLAPAVAALVVAAIVGEGMFLRARLAEWSRAAGLVRNAIHTLDQGLDAGVREVYWVNLPRALPGRFWRAWAFGNVGEFLPLMLRPPRTDVRSHAVYDRSFAGSAAEVEAQGWPTVGRYLSRAEIERRLQQPGTIGFEFVTDPPGFRRLGGTASAAAPAADSRVP